MKSRILITGSSGFIGYHLAEKFLKENFSIIGIDSLNDYYDVEIKKNRTSNLKKYEKFNFHEFNICDNAKLRTLCKKEKPDLIIHLAAQAGVRYSNQNPAAYFESNIFAFHNIIEQAKKHNIKLIYASSSSVYGGEKRIPFKETFSTRPLSLYGATKKINEKIAEFYFKSFSLNAIGLRFFTVYGPHGRPDMAYFKFSDLIKEGRPITVFNKGKMSRDMTYIDDLCDGIIACVEKNFSSHQVFNLGNNKPVKLLNLISLIEQHFNKRAIIEYKNSEMEIEETFADLTKSKDLLGYNPKIGLEDGMKEFLIWHSKIVNNENI